LSAAVHIADSYIAQPNIAYVTAQNYRAKLDIYRPAKDTASPVVIYIHGGGTIHDKGHGDFNSAENLRVWITIQDFLQTVGITPLPQ
jgi:acetyl esterase/lipase